jgi:predicted RNA binding protein YcfA (HicA-like mRNA interferase family)
MKATKLLETVRASAANVSFADMRRLIGAFGFQLSRVKGSHHIFIHPNMPELVNLQEVKGKAKPYQFASSLSLWKSII